VWPADAPEAEEFAPGRVLGDAVDATDRRYFFGLARELDRLAPERGTTFLLTWHVDAFDDSFAGAVVLLVGDEKYQIPSYADKVSAIFKTGGTRRNPLAQTLRTHPSIAWRLLLREARNTAEQARNTAPQVRRQRTLRRTAPAPMHEVPIGYFNLGEVPHVPFEQREVDVFFAGSVESDRGFTVRPRLLARRQMSAALERARARRPRLRVDYTNSGPFANPNGMLDPESYTRRLMAARIALCPRGNIDETFRLVEAARCGCIAISEPLPRRWYNRDSPVVEIDRWDALP
jgi:hypothetical protein